MPLPFLPSILKTYQAIHSHYMWYTLKDGNSRHTHTYSQSSVTECVVRVQQF